MALIVEDGTGKADAESYVSIAEVNDYATKRGLGFVIAGDAAAAAEAAARRATAWLDGFYAMKFPGKPTSVAQALEWPRTCVQWRGQELGNDVIPAPVKKACCEAAIRELASPGALSPDVVGTARVLREKVGDLEVQYADVGGVEAARPLVTVIDGILSGLLGGRTGEATWLWR